MKSRHLVDPDLAVAIDLLPTFDLNARSLVQYREQRLAFPPTDPGLIESRVVTVPGDDGHPPLSLHIYRPANVTARLPCIYYMHGGGFILGSADEYADWVMEHVLELGCAIVSVDYPLAPEAPFPAAIDDCYRGLIWVHENAVEIGVDDKLIGVMGESAGGGLAAALALMVRDRGEIRLAFQHLIFPMLDDRTSLRADLSIYSGEFVWTRENNLFGWSSLLGRAPGDDDVSPYAAPARAKELTRLPPTFICCGALDLFLEEDLEYARRLIRSGVPTELHVYPGAFHGFELIPTAAVSQASVMNSRAALRRFMRLDGGGSDDAEKGCAYLMFVPSSSERPPGKHRGAPVSE